MRERAIETKLREAVMQAGGWAVKYGASFHNGFPDRMVLMPSGRVAFVELKAPGKHPTALQRHVHDKLRTLGFRVEVIDSIAQIYPLIESLQPCNSDLTNTNA
jgi:hypothetical protein